ncbi:MAG: GxxExxY protein, partial [Phycisphaerales bacterium]|nr:GxxExxY protein [Phycisphaerales bacterium]
HQDTKSPRTTMEKIDEVTDAIAKQIADAAYAVHSTLGPGLLENVYESCLEYELKERGLRVERQVALPVTYKKLRLDAGMRLDLVVADRIVVELKAVESLTAVHTAQILTYLKLTGLRLGFLINFNVALIKDGIKRVAL